MTWREREQFKSEEAWLQFRLQEADETMGRVSDGKAREVIGTLIEEIEAQLSVLATMRAPAGI